MTEEEFVNLERQILNLVETGPVQIHDLHDLDQDIVMLRMAVSELVSYGLLAMSRYGKLYGKHKPENWYMT